MEAARTPRASLEEVFLRAAGELEQPDGREKVVAEALGHLQRGFDDHYAGGVAEDEAILTGDDAYARAVETISFLDEPRFVEVAARMIRDGAGRISSGGEVSLELWTPHLADLLGIISGESADTSESRIHRAASAVEGS